MASVHLAMDRVSEHLAGGVPSPPAMRHSLRLRKAGKLLRQRFQAHGHDEGVGKFGTVDFGIGRLQRLGRTDLLNHTLQVNDVAVGRNARHRQVVLGYPQDHTQEALQILAPVVRERFARG
ncbi:hypothetical protein D3C81_634920 [compost metagenome]